MRIRVETLGSLALALILLGSSPAAAQIAIGSSLHDDTEARPGASYAGTIIIRNLSELPQQAKVYQTDYLFQSDGSNRFGEPGNDPRSNADWINVMGSTVTVPPQGAVPLEYTVDVPTDIEGQPLDGSYWSMIMVEAVPRESAESTVSVQDSEIQLGVRQVVRYGIQIATHVQGTGEGRLNAVDPALSVLDEGHAQLELAVSNEGTRLVVPETWVELYDESGTSLGRFEGATSRIYPGTSVRQRYDLGTLASGAYKALAVFDSGGDTVDAAEYALSIDP